MSSPNYDFANLNDQGAKVYQAQRKISFPEEHEEMPNFKSMKRPESPNDQPIDYSQLSSRRKETNDERRKGNPHYAVNGQETRHIIGIQKSEARLMSGTVTADTRNSSTKNTVLTPKYDFILSPKMDGNGNIIIPQSPQSSCKPPLSSQVQNFKVGRDAYQPPASFSYHESNPAGSYKQQSSPLYGSPASPKFGSTDPKQESIINLAKAKFEATTYDQDKTGISKPQVPYHPKLKYLLAASKFAKAKDQQNNGVSATAEAAAASISPSHQSHQSMLFSHDQAAPADTQPKLNEQQQNVFSRSEADHVHGIPPNEIFHAINSTPNYKFHNSNVFVLNAMSSFKPNTSPTDISTGSPLNEKQQHRHIDIRHSQLNSSSSSTSPSAVYDIPEMFNESRTTDQYPCDKVHTTPLSMSPSSPSQPLSPASLRDQQSALSELLFSSTRKSGIDPYACADCGKRYSTSSNLARHRQTHRSVCDKKARKCPHCDKVYVSMPAYSMHVRTHNQGCECPHCGKKFSRPWLLQGHIRTHTGEKPFGCPQCGKSFADKSNLRAHIQTHSTEKPYVCGRCGKAFALKSYLYKHEESSCMRGQRFRR